MLAHRERALGFAQAPSELAPHSLSLDYCFVSFLQSHALFCFVSARRSATPHKKSTDKRCIFVVEMIGIEPISDADMRGHLQV